METGDEKATGKLRELQLLELDLFKDFADFCETHGLTYYAMGGTLLGAVRHGGFIPWDDDMDLGMPREDYERFLLLYDAENARTNLHWHGNDREHTRYFARLENPHVKVVRRDMDPPELTPAWIDIFPLDGMPDGGVHLWIKRWQLMYRRAAFRLSQPNHTIIVDNRPWYEKLLINLQEKLPTNKVFDFDREWRLLDKCLKSHPYGRSKVVINAMGHWKFREMFPKECYGEGVFYPFEDTWIRGPKDYDAVCASLYGDYMTPMNTGHHLPDIDIETIY